MIQDGEDGDYEGAYREIRALVEKADIAFINQETLLAGEDFGFSGYPLFNTPQKLGRAVAAAGFNVVNHATNHIMDKGEKAVFATLDFWDTIPEVTVLGIHRSEEKRKLPALIRKNNITLGFLSYTYGTNGIPVPKDKPFLVSLINNEIMAGEIDAIRPLCDFLVVSMHWGDEHSHSYNKQQENLAAFLAEHKVDLVIGHHPHVIQPIENIKRPDGKSMLCFYSLGNLISAQIDPSTMLGAMAYVKLIKNDEDCLAISDYGAIPLVTHYDTGYSNFKVYPLYAYTEELAEKHTKNREKKVITIDYLGGTAARIFKDKDIRYNPFEHLPDSESESNQ
jgi:poly-gamma-glutamate synthesis protein (capsule biosynthesis protein)